MASHIQYCNFKVFGAAFSSFQLANDLKRDEENSLVMARGLWIILQSESGPWSESRPPKVQPGKASNVAAQRMLKALDSSFFEGHVVANIAWVVAEKKPLNLKRDGLALSKWTLVMFASEPSLSVFCVENQQNISLVHECALAGLFNEKVMSEYLGKHDFNAFVK